MLNNSADRYTGTAHFKPVDLNGNELFSGDATMQGSRIVVEL